MQFIDTHTHLYTEEFDPDRAEAVERARQAGAALLLLPNIDEASVAPMLRMCKDYPGFCLPMMGLHPTELPDGGCDEPLDHMESLLAAPGHPYVGIGEVGIDLYWDTSRREEQTRAFRRQIEWSVRFGLPLSIHCRAAHRETMEALRPYKEQLCGGVFHCFGGGREEAEELMETFPGFALGIGGVATFKKSDLPRVLRETVPIGRIVVETDAPYLAPVPFRGKRNEPAYIPHILARIAEAYGISPEEAARETTETAKRIFRLNGKPRLSPEEA